MKNFIPISKPSITDKEIKYINDAAKSGWVSSLGKYIDDFENQFSEFIGVNFGLATSNGTAALHLALETLGIGEGDEVIIPDLTFIATANAVKYAGAKVVTVDIEADTLCIDPDSIRKNITSNTKAIIPVHLYGHPANMPEINKLAKEHEIFVIEDAAEAHGAEINGQKVGSFGDCSIFSFYGNKVMTSGEGGMVVTDNESLFRRAKHLRDHAMSDKKRYWHTDIGYNYRMTNLQAALGLAQAERIEELIAKKLEIFDWYKKGLKDINGVKLNYQADWAKNVYWMICLEYEFWGEKERNQFQSTLRDKNIDSRPYFYPISDMPMYKESDTFIVHDVYKKGLNLPTYFDLSLTEVNYICETVKAELDS